MACNPPEIEEEAREEATSQMPVEDATSKMPDESMMLDELRSATEWRRNMMIMMVINY